MSTGTTLIDFKRALRDRLSERPGLADVQVRYAQSETDLTPAEMWFTDARAGTEIPVFRGPNQVLKVQEEYTVKLVIQVLKNQGESQETADMRAVELLREVQEELAENPEVIPEIHYASLTGWEYKFGALKSGHGAGFECLIRVRARLYPQEG